MKKIFISGFSTVILVTFCIAQSSEFNRPWLDTSRAIIIDPYYANAIDWDKLKKDPRVVGIIHKATEAQKTDPKYKARKSKAISAGYKFGSYHLGRPGDPVKQADYYLETVMPGNDELIALDLEGLDPALFMTLENAIKFINRVKEKINRYPVIYANQAVVKDISKKYGGQSVFSKCNLWYARFKQVVTDFPQNTWNTYLLWQFSCEINCQPDLVCQYVVPGTNHDMDVNVYNGTIEDLLGKWPFDR